MSNAGHLLKRSDYLAFIEALFPTDARGRLVGSAPHFHLLRAREDVIARFHSDLSDHLVHCLEALCRAERGRPAKWQYEYGAYLDAIVAANLGIAAMRAGPLYCVPPSLVPEHGCVPIDAGNTHLLIGGFDEWLPQVAKRLPFCAAVEDNRAVAICASVHASRGAHCAGVETLGAHKGRGFAAAAVTGWARAVHARGATPFYGTTFDNLSSQAVARRLGLPLVGSEFLVQCRA